MKKYIERYIYDVTRRLPKEIQEEVSKELEANIYDMLPENHTDEDVDKVLHDLGHPRKIANNYKENKRYVISPLYYDDYLRVLKIVIIIIGVISLVTSSIDSLINVNEQSVFEAIGYVTSRIIGDFVSSIISVFAIVTLIFWAIDHYAAKDETQVWKLKDLPDLPSVKTTKIPRTNIIIGMIFHTIFSTLFIIYLLKYVSITGFYENQVFISPFLNENITDQFIVFIIIAAIIGFFVYMIQLYEGQWSIKVSTVYTASSIISLTLVLLFINHPQIISNSFFDTLASRLDVTVAYLKDGLKNILTWVTVIAIVITIIDLVSIWLKTLKPKQHKV